MTFASRRLVAGVALLALVGVACGNDEDDLAGPPETTTTEASDDHGDDGAAGEASVEFAAPADGDTVPQRFNVEMVAEDFTIEAASEGVHEGAGHFHVMVDVGCVDVGETIPKDDTHIHFGGGQTEAQLFLDPGEHSLCLQAADGEHTALDITDEITVTVDGDLPFVTLGVPEGETVASPVALTMEATNFDVAPAADGVVEGAGHFHVMVDTDCVEVGETIPSDDSHRHFGDGSTTAELELEPGEHTLCLQMGDGEHTALDLTHVVTVTVA